MNNDATSQLPVEIDDLANRLFFRLYQSANLLHKSGTRALEKTGITTQQWAVIGALARPGCEAGVSVGDLTRFLLVSRQNLTGVLSRMEREGVIERMVSPLDSRSRLIRLSAEGQQLWRGEMSRLIAAYYEAALEGFSTTDKIHAIHYLDKLLTNMKRIDSKNGGGDNIEN
jgi:DNA-binding MarR family transcriptional regulator